MKIAILNDTHAGARNSSEIFIDYQEAFYSSVFFPYLREHGITRIIHLGDYYDHRKYVNFKVLNANRSHFLDKLREYGMHMWVIPGNHDVAYKNTNSLCSLQELMLGHTDVVTVEMEPTELDFDGCKIALIPWINPENYGACLDMAATSKARVCMGHFEFTGFLLYPGVNATHGMNHTDWNRFEAVYSGHYHHKSQIGNVRYLGSQLEFTWADAGDPKHFHIFDTETLELTPVLNPITLFQKVIYDDVQFDYNNFDYSIFDYQYVKIMVSRKTDPFTFERFVDKIKTRVVHDLKIVENMSDLNSDPEFDEEVKFESTVDLINAFVDAADTVLDKKSLKDRMRTLYVEAQTYEVSE